MILKENREIMFRYLLTFSLIANLFTNINSQDAFIHVDQFGYYLEASKVAVISDPKEGFNANLSFTPGELLEVRNSTTDELAFSAQAILWNNGNTDELSGDAGWHLDFTELKTAGKYYIIDPSSGEKSPVFSISDNPYLEVLKSAFKMYYYNRSSFKKETPYADERWTDEISFEQDEKCRYIYDQDNIALEKDLRGGWFDAGDYNKYITFTYSVIHDLLTAYESAPEVFTDDWNIPESGNDLPDILDEVKWELDWMKKMFNDDGSVHIKMGSRNHSENVSSPPSMNTDLRYYGPVCTASSATLASNFAHAALVFNKQYEHENYAQELIEMAQAAFDYVLPRLQVNNLDTGCDDGSIVSGDADLTVDLQKEVMLNAAIYLYEFTGLERYNTFIKGHTTHVEPITSSWWGPYKISLQDALLRYTTLNNADPDTKSLIESAANGTQAQAFYGMNDATLYRDYIPTWAYHWGSNNPKAGFANLNLMMNEYELSSNEESYFAKAEELLHSFHGLNPLGLVYLSNMYEEGATKSVNEIYHTWFNDGTDYDHALTSSIGPAPGYVVGGPNQNFSINNISPPSNQPATKSYLDFNTGWPDNSWEISEPAIYYQASYIRLLSQIIGKRGIGTVSSTDETFTKKFFSLYPNPGDEYLHIELDAAFKNALIEFTIWDIQGREIKSGLLNQNNSVSIKNLLPGTYIIHIKGNSISEKQQFVKI